MSQIRLSTESDTAALADIWRASVRATHDFLQDADFREIDTLVAELYLPATRVWVGVYRHMGFAATGRSPTDDAGRPYPLLHMRQE